MIRLTKRMEATMVENDRIIVFADVYLWIFGYNCTCRLSADGNNLRPMVLRREKYSERMEASKSRRWSWFHELRVSVFPRRLHDDFKNRMIGLDFRAVWSRASVVYFYIVVCRNNWCYSLDREDLSDCFPMRLITRGLPVYLMCVHENHEPVLRGAVNANVIV